MKFMIKDLFYGKHIIVLLALTCLCAGNLFFSYADARHLSIEYQTLAKGLEGMDVLEVEESVQDQLAYLSEIDAESIELMEEAWLNRYLYHELALKDEEYSVLYEQVNTYLAGDGLYASSIAIDQSILARLKSNITSIGSFTDVIAQKVMIYDRNISRSYLETDLTYWNLMKNKVLQTEEPLFYDTLAIESFVNAFAIDYIMILLVLLSSALIFCRDYTNNRYILLSSKPAFPRKYVLSKIGTAISIVLYSVISYTVINFFFFLHAGGNIHIFCEPIQIVPSLQNMVSNKTVLEMMVVLIIQKLIFYVVLSFVSMMISAMSKNYIIAISVTSLCIFISYAITLLGSRLLPNAEILQINLFSLFHAESILYLSELFLMGDSLVSIATVFYLSLLLMSALLFVLLVFSYKKISMYVNYL